MTAILAISLFAIQGAVTTTFSSSLFPSASAQIQPPSPPLPSQSMTNNNMTMGQQPSQQPLLAQNQTSLSSTNATASFTSALDRLKEQARIHNQQRAAAISNLTAQTRQKARDVSNAVDGILIYYARAVGEIYKEPINVTTTAAATNAQVLSVRIPVVPLTGLNATTGSGGVKIVSSADYLIAQGLAIKAIESFTDLSSSVTQASPDTLTMQQLADTQQGLSVLYSMINSKVSYNLIEDAALSPVKSNLDNIFGASTATIS